MRYAWCALRCAVLLFAVLCGVLCCYLPAPDRNKRWEINMKHERSEAEHDEKAGARAQNSREDLWEDQEKKLKKKAKPETKRP